MQRYFKFHITSNSDTYESTKDKTIGLEVIGERLKNDSQDIDKGFFYKSGYFCYNEDEIDIIEEVFFLSKKEIENMNKPDNILMGAKEVVIRY